MTCQQLRAAAQDYANSPAAKNNYVTPREMTREDLGLPRIVHAYGRDWVVIEPPAPSYAFWLGAEAA
jgi:hypothetical protein